MRTSTLLKQYTERARLFYSAGRKGKVEHIKTTLLPAFAPAGYLMDGKGRKNLIGLTGICFIDIDHIDGAMVEKCMQLLQKDVNVLMASRSISGRGIHILVPYTFRRDDPFPPLPCDPVRLNKLYGQVFGVIAAHYRQLLGVQIDEAVKNTERLCLVSYDADTLYNPQAQPIEIQY